VRIIVRWIIALKIRASSYWMLDVGFIDVENFLWAPFAKTCRANITSSCRFFLVSDGYRLTPCWTRHKWSPVTFSSCVIKNVT